jgi:hypothetical protein
LAWGVCLLLAAAGGQAQTAGEVEFARGVGFAQTPGENPRTLGRGMQLKEGDRLTTADGASAIIKLADGTRMTVRPNSELVLQQYQFKENAPDNSMLMQLVRGGFRAVTGLISKTSPNAARVQTNTATIGIRGTDFDARVCAKDCGAESAKVADASRPNAVLASAKVVSAQGDVNAVDGAGQRRRLVDGGSIYPGDMVETGAGTRAVLVFRDQSRMSLGSGTKFRVDNFVFDEKNAGEGRFLVSLLRGSVRALTGLIAKANNRNVGFSTATATIGIRGSGGDISCTGACAGEPGGGDAGLSVFTWLGSFTVTPQGQPGECHAGAAGGAGPVHFALGHPPDCNAAAHGHPPPRPDQRAPEHAGQVVCEQQRGRYGRRSLRFRTRRPHRDRQQERSPAPGQGRSRLCQQQRRHGPARRHSQIHPVRQPPPAHHQEPVAGQCAGRLGHQDRQAVQLKSLQGVTKRACGCDNFSQW